MASEQPWSALCDWCTSISRPGRVSGLRSLRLTDVGVDTSLTVRWTSSVAVSPQTPAHTVTTSHTGTTLLYMPGAYTPTLHHHTSSVAQTRANSRLPFYTNLTATNLTCSMYNTHQCAYRQPAPGTLPCCTTTTTAQLSTCRAHPRICPGSCEPHQEASAARRSTPH